MYLLVLVFFAEQMVAGRRIILYAVLQAFEKIILWVTELVFYLTDDDVIDLFLIINICIDDFTLFLLRNMVGIHH